MNESKITASEARKAYLKEWRLKNKDRVKKYNDRYWERKAAQMQSEEGDGQNADDAVSEDQRCR